MRRMHLGAWLCGVLLATAGSALAAPCTTVSGCSEWMTLGSGSARVLVYRSFPLETKNAEITRAVVVVHGAGRDADNYFRHMLAGAFLAGGLENTVVISPRFASNNGDCHDALAEHEANWQCRGSARWTAGGIRRFRFSRRRGPLLLSILESPMTWRWLF